MEHLNDIWTAWNSHWAGNIGALLGLIAILFTTSEKIHRLASRIKNWNGWGAGLDRCRRVLTRYRRFKAKKAVRKHLVGKRFQIGIREFDSALNEEPVRSSRSAFEKVTPAKPRWLNDYFMAAALEELWQNGKVVKARMYPPNQWPSDPQSYLFRIPERNDSARDEAEEIETDGMCAAYQEFLLPRCRSGPKPKPKWDVHLEDERERRQTIIGLRSGELCSDMSIIY